MTERCPEIEDLARRFFAAKRAGDGDAVVAMLADDADIYWIGTGAEDWFLGHDAVAAAHLSTPTGIEIRSSEPIGWRQGGVAWVADRPLVRFPDEESESELRFTAIAILQAEEWRFVQGQVSVPDS